MVIIKQKVLTGLTAQIRTLEISSLIADEKADYNVQLNQGTVDLVNALRSDLGELANCLNKTYFVHATRTRQGPLSTAGVLP